MASASLVSQGVNVAHTVGVDRLSVGAQQAVHSSADYLESSLDVIDSAVDTLASLPLLHRFDDRITRVLSLDRYGQRIGHALGFGEQDLYLAEQQGHLERSLTAQVADVLQAGLEPFLITTDSLLLPGLAADLLVAGGDALKEGSGSVLSRTGEWVSLAGIVLGGQHNDNGLAGVAARSVSRHSGIPRLDEQAVIGLVDSVGSDDKSTLAATALLGRTTLSNTLAVELTGVNRDIGGQLSRPSQRLQDSVTDTLAPAQQLGELATSLTAIIDETQATLHGIQGLVDESRDVSRRLDGLPLSSSLSDGVTLLGQLDGRLSSTGQTVLPTVSTVAEGLAWADASTRQLTQRAGDSLAPITDANMASVEHLTNTVIQAPMAARPVDELSDAVLSLGDGMGLAPIAAGLDWVMVVPINRNIPANSLSGVSVSTGGHGNNRHGVDPIPPPQHLDGSALAGSRADQMP
ncbi:MULTISPECIES: hypothetical protein [Halomonas]|uniref:hypothetical protein n=1 Tax=Halomonas TaxID=2745 RepID=UPI001C9455D0|nr:MULTISPECIES: hypothetical protein [Halomonas]MBY6208376.1 hypothetical protein [Halomonas sp. DP3Y7-2]MBY6230611.1 hypothetical protein [Halomonas sp. DP3Y7-1]MCA0918500.1 hypothetical protein [Halomonas denitrificans]